MRPARVTACALALLLVPAAHALGSGVSLESGSDGHVLANAALTVRVDPDRPSVALAPTGREGLAFAYRPSRLVEFVDENENGAYEEGEERAELPLAQASDWTSTRLVQKNQVLLNFTRSAAPRILPPREGRLALPPMDAPEPANVSFLFSLGPADAGASAQGLKLDPRAGALETHLVIHRWPRLDPANGRLALVIEVDAQANLAGAPSGEGLVAHASGAPLGWLSWAPLGSAKTLGATEHVPVGSVLATNGTRATLVLSYAARGLERLSHGSHAGVPEDLPGARARTPPSPIPLVENAPVAGVPLAAAVVTIAAAILSRRIRGPP